MSVMTDHCNCNLMFDITFAYGFKLLQKSDFFHDSIVMPRISNFAICGNSTYHPTGKKKKATFVDFFLGSLFLLLLGLNLII